MCDKNDKKTTLTSPLSERIVNNESLIRGIITLDEETDLLFPGVYYEGEKKVNDSKVIGLFRGVY